MVRASIRVLVLATTMLTGIAASSAGELPRRGVLGVKLSGAGGIVKVEEVMNPALGALKPGDQIVAVDGKPVATTAEVIGALGRRREGDLVPLGLKRGGEAVQMDARLMAAPVPAVDGRVMELGEVTLPSGIRVRTQLARPNSDKLTRDGKAPAMMMLQGIPCITNDTFASTIGPIGRLYKTLNDAGFAIYLVEKPGTGDSEGEDCRTGGFDIEVEAFRAAAQELAKLPGIDASRLFGVGISMGAIQVPLIANDAGFKGIVTWGGAVSPLYDYLMATFRRRFVLQNMPAGETEPLLRVWRKVLAAAFVDRLDRAAIAARMPDDLKVFEDSAGSLDEVGGRSLRFAQECDDAPVTAGWQAYRGELLALHGEFDWVSEAYDDALSAYIVNANNPGKAAFETVPGLDHTMTAHATLADSFPNLMKGAQSDLFEKRAAAWLIEKAAL